MALSAKAQEIAARIDQRLAARRDQIVAMQHNYLAQHGRYFQGIATQDQPPKDEVAARPNFDRKPTDQPHTWRDVGAHNLFPPSFESRLAAHVYDGPLGKGFIVVLDFQLGTRVIQKAIDFGPEQRSHDWLDREVRT